jgi:hypothetical protein
MRGSRLLFSTTMLVACAGSTRYRTELVGHGNGMVASRASGATDVVNAGGIQVAQGNYDLAMRFDVPRAQVIDWRLVCPGVELDGQVGETLEQYRARRIEELRRETDRERERVSAATSLVVGAVAPRVEVRGRNVHGEVGLDANAVGDSFARGAVGDVMLPADDVGRGSLAASARVMTAGDGVCALHVSADDADVRASFTVTRIRDLDAEDRMRTIAAREVAVKARGQLADQLVTNGANPKVHVETKRDVTARLEAAAIFARHEYLAFLSGKCGADPGRRARLEERIDASAAAAQRRDQIAMQARATIRARLLALGAKERPPMPAAKPETPGAPPQPGAEWEPGYWSWISGGWEWHDGGWLFDDDDYVVVGGGGNAGGGATRTRVHQPGTRDHRDRRDDSPAWDPSYFKRDESKDTSRTRDHRRDSSWEPKAEDKGARVRDHRDDDKKKDDDDDDKKDDKPRVRDHR